MNIINRVCDVCGSEESRYWFRPSRSPGPIVQCKHCGFVYVNPIESTHALILSGPVLGNRSPHLLKSGNLEEIKGSWEEPIIEGYLRELRAKQINALDLLAHIQQFRIAPGNVLDVGCFCGVFLDIMHQAGWECTGLEPLVMPAIYARARYGLHIFTDVLRDTIFPAEHFDLITLLQVLEHIVYPKSEIEKCQRILKPGGLLIVEVPNIDTWMIKLLGPRHRHFVQDHVSFFSGNTLHRLFSKLDFAVREIYYPIRAISFAQLLFWLETYSHSLARGLKRVIHPRILQKTFRLGLGDIVTVIGEKT